MARIFLLEDDTNFGNVLKSYLEVHEHEVFLESNGIRAIDSYRRCGAELCIFDVMLPGKDGFSVAREMKELNPLVPFIFLTARTLKQDILEGYKIGAEDYISKPFDSEVLLHKISVILKRRNSELPKAPAAEINEYRIGNYQFNASLRTLNIDGAEIRISPKEAGLLKLLCLHMNDILPRDKALKLIWGDSNYFTTRSMDVFITKLRKYFLDDPRIEIENIHGDGFRLIVKA